MDTTRVSVSVASALASAVGAPAPVVVVVAVTTRDPALAMVADVVVTKKTNQKYDTLK